MTSVFPSGKTRQLQPLNYPFINNLGTILKKEYISCLLPELFMLFTYQQKEFSIKINWMNIIS